jgi:predicted Zn-dependent peptidase
MSKNVNLHIIKTKKFKTNLINVFLKRPLRQDEVSKNALLTMVLGRGSKNYPNTKVLSEELENLYGAAFVWDTAKKGEKNIIRIAFQMVNDMYVKDDHVFKKGLSILNDFINNPLVENNKFNEEYVKQEKKNLIERIEAQKNDKMRYAYDRCIEEMCKGEPFALSEYGSVEDVNKITPEELYSHYEDIIKSSEIDLCVVGNVKKDEIEKIIEENLKFNVDSVVPVKREKISGAREEVQVVTDEMDINQGKLTLGYKTNVAYEDKLYNPLVVYSSILGGGVNSKLFKNVREKESLCYYVFSRIEKFKSLMFIGSGIEFDKYERAIEVIGEQIDSMKKGDFNEDDIISAKNSIITSVRSMTDSAGMLSDFYYTQSISKTNDSIEEIIEKIRRVSKEEIIEVASKIQLDTIYFLKNKGEEK